MLLARLGRYAPLKHSLEVVFPAYLSRFDQKYTVHIDYEKYINSNAHRDSTDRGFPDLIAYLNIDGKKAGVAVLQGNIEPYNRYFDGMKVDDHSRKDFVFAKPVSQFTTLLV